PGNDLEEIAAAERLLRDAHGGRVLAPLVVARTRDARRGAVRLRAAVARQAARASGGGRELVARAHGALALVVDHDQVVGPVEAQTGRLGRPRTAELDGLELEREIVAEGAVEPEVRVRRAREQVAHGADDRQRRRLAGPLLLREAGGGERDRSDRLVFVARGAGCGGGGREEHAPARVQRGGPGLAAPWGPRVGGGGDNCASGPG